jgi:flagellar biosynthesis/type III secretory pathway protein FliH
VNPQARAIDFTAVPVAITIMQGILPAMEEPIDTRVSLEEHESACQEAYNRGFHEATEALTNQIAEQRAEVAQLQDAVFKNLAAQSETLAHEVSQILPDLILEITQRVLAGFKPDAETVRNTISETLAEVAPGSTDVELRLHPQDLALVRGVDAELEQKYPGIKLTADSELTPGDCVAKSRFGMIDARVLTKLQNVARSLK